MDFIKDKISPDIFVFKWDLDYTFFYSYNVLFAKDEVRHHWLIFSTLAIFIFEYIISIFEFTSIC